MTGKFRINVGNGLEIQPRTFTEYRTKRESGNIVHPILGRKWPDVSLRPATARSGSIEMRIPIDAAGWGRQGTWAEDCLSRGELCSVINTLGDSGLKNEVWMFFVVVGDITKQLDPTRTEWIIAFDFQEVETPERVYITTPGMDPLPEDAA